MFGVLRDDGLCEIQEMFSFCMFKVFQKTG
jgi:hypothetical protein